MSQEALDAHGTVVTQEADSHEQEMLLTVVARDGNEAIKWYSKALKATTKFRFDDKSGKVMHAVLKSAYGFSFAVEDDCGLSPVQPLETAPSSTDAPSKTRGCTYMYVTLDPKLEHATTCDQAVALLKECGGIVLKEPKDEFYGHRLGVVQDVWGVVWAISHRLACATESSKDSA